ncbi:MAG: adenine deaminase [Chitinophagia bacterium]|nr:adenine deaminase [Chitinophagia bacterium]
METTIVTGYLVNIHQRSTYGARITISNGRIDNIEPHAQPENVFLMPGFVDAHIHIESSMVVPTAFAQVAVTHGTVATVSDPHEIANVCGMRGVQYMIDNARQSPFKFHFGAPSCVPATSFETAGAVLNVADVTELLQSPDIWYLSEMMNFPGVLHNDPEVTAKIAAAKAAGKPIDGHAPGLRGDAARQYAAAGITTDHECVALEEAVEKIEAGMHILIREGSAARNYNALHPLLASHPASVMFCSDDKHPDELMHGHINELVVRSIALGYDLYDVLRAASLHPVQHYGLPVGLLRVGDPADFIAVTDLTNFKILKTYLDGVLVYDNGCNKLQIEPVSAINNFAARRITASVLKVVAPATTLDIRVIQALDGQLITKEMKVPARVENGLVVADVERDILKVVVISRYEPAAPPSVAFIHGFGLKHGAIASTIAHDSHNIIAVGADDESIATAINGIIDAHGGISVALSSDDVLIMPLSVGGLMSLEPVEQVADIYTRLDKAAKSLGTPLRAPFMTLSFMALLVIPALKLSDKGLFDGTTFGFTSLQV